MAPEQIMGSNIGPWTDLYATALIYIELVTGSPPMLGSNPTATIQRQIEEEVPIPRWLRDSPIGPILLKGLAKDWKDRYPSAADMYADIDREVRSGGGSNLDSFAPPPRHACRAIGHLR